MINVPDYQGVGMSQEKKKKNSFTLLIHTFVLGEFCPRPHFFQNLGEAEYVVALYQFLRSIGHPASSISILTTYKGQKNLIRDILARRCAPLAQYGLPGKLSTVDKYQVSGGERCSGVNFL